MVVSRHSLVRTGERANIIRLRRMGDAVKVCEVNVGGGEASKIGGVRRGDGIDFSIFEPNPNDMLDFVNGRRRGSVIQSLRVTLWTSEQMAAGQPHDQSEHG